MTNSAVTSVNRAYSAVQTGYSLDARLLGINPTDERPLRLPVAPQEVGPGAQPGVRHETELVAAVAGVGLPGEEDLHDPHSSSNTPRTTASNPKIDRH
jgi:hypothetical protein